MANLNSSIINGFLIVNGKLKAKSLEVESSDLVTNLNADLLDGKQGSEYAASADLSTLQTDVEDLSTQVNTNTGNILQNMQDIQDNTEAIATNKGNITNLTTRVTTDEGNISQNTSDITALKTKTDTTNTNLSNLTTRVGTAESNIDALETKTDTTNTNVSNLQSQVNSNATNIQTNTNNINGLETRLTTDEASISNNTERIDEILAGTAEIPSVANAEKADDADKLGGQLPAYYAKTSDLSGYLPLTGGTVTGLTKFLGTAADNSLMVRGIKGSTADGSAADALYLNYNNNHPVYINGTNTAYHSGNIPKASTSKQGIVQLDGTHTSTSTTTAPTAKALKDAYDSLNTEITTHTGDTDVHLSATDRVILNKANKFKGYYETETALNEAHPTGEAGDYAIVNSTDTVWIWDADKEGGAGWKDGAGKGSVISVNNMTGEVVLTKSNIGLGNVDNTSDANKPVSTAQQAALDGKVSKTGDTMTGKLIVPKVETGTAAENYFQCRKFRGQGDADTYYHAIDFGYSNHDRVDFYEYGGVWQFHKHTGATQDASDTIVGTINSNGWVGGAQLSGTPTAPTAAAGTSTTQIATTEFVTNAGNNKVSKSGDTMTGNLYLDGVTNSVDTNTAKIVFGNSTTSYVETQVNQSGLMLFSNGTNSMGFDLEQNAVKFNDEVNIKYNADNECLDFIFV